jgi:hypothetical protein
MKKLGLFFIALLSFLFTTAQDCSNDVTNPWFTNFQEDVTILCSDDLSSVFPTAHDDCDTLVEIAYYDEVSPGYCPSASEIVRIYRAFDDSGNSKVEMQFIHIVDELAPVFAYVPPSLVLSCSDTTGFGVPIVFDNCSTISLSFEDFSEIESNCMRRLTRMWTAVDECGNSSMATQILQFIDLMPPVITGDPFIELPAGSSIDTVFVQVSENCNGYNIYYTDMPASGNNIIRTYTAVDECGNSSSFEQIIGFAVSQNVQLCHRLGNGNYITITVNQNAVQAHLNHGDYLGPCNIQNWQNQNVPFQMGLEMKEDGTIVKRVKQK